jgi:alpha-amylase/alpha-mannosidase (GH57 family)
MGAVKLNLVLCWHMHQPHYREGLDGPYRLPWVYLHGIKDYTDMAAHLEAHPKMHVVVNFAPVLLEQLDDYANQISYFCATGTPTADSLLNQLAGASPIPCDAAGRAELIRYCLRCHAPRMIDPYPAFQQLVSWFHHLQHFVSNDELDANDAMLRYLDEQYFIDLLVWYHLSWLGESLRQQPEVMRLFAQGSNFDLTDRRELLDVMQAALAGVIPRFRRLAKSGQIELSMTPYGHPIVPLLHDFANMRCALPDAPQPDAESYPGGAERSRWHMEKGLQLFADYFGQRPRGVWLSEGGISPDALALLDQYQIRWTATGEGVWRNSCHLSNHDAEDIAAKRRLFAPHQHAPHQVRIFFRDDGLSDLIGFEYSSWDAQHAASDFVGHLETIAHAFGDSADQYVVSVILDGENAWEYYPHNGHYFLNALYQTCLASEHVRVRTFDEVVDLPVHHLSELCPGSWVYGSFSTWIGQEDKNRAWDLLVKAKRVYDSVVARQVLTDEQLQMATRQLAVCEASDWFWWFGDYNPAGSVSDFEQLFRLQLKRLYALLEQTAPDELNRPIAVGGAAGEHAGTMRRTA